MIDERASQAERPSPTVPSISVIIPTYQRCQKLRQSLDSLARQTAPADTFEVIVVVDGSSDGTIAMLQSYAAPYTLRWLVQDHAGQAAACNRGSREASGILVLSLDDDTIARADLIEQYLRAQSENPGTVVQGAFDVDCSILVSPYLRYEARRLAAFETTQSRSGGVFAEMDVSGGNLLVPRDLLERAGGFCEQLRDVEDVDGELAQRLVRQGARLVYWPQARATLTDLKDLPARLHAAERYGRSYVRVHRMQPATIWRTSSFLTDRGSRLRRALRALIACTSSWRWRLGWLERALAPLNRLCELVRARRLAEALYRLRIELHFWKGVSAESQGRLGRYVPRPVTVLCYHDVTSRIRSAFRQYMLSPSQFSLQMKVLGLLGYQPIGLDRLYDYLTAGRPLPRKPVVLTFDDGYGALLRTATPLLAQMHVPHAHFLNSAKLGHTTDWVTEAPDLTVMRREEIREALRSYGDWVDFQAHGRDHASLAASSSAAVAEQVTSCVREIEAITGRPVRYLAYPYGEYDEQTVRVVSELQPPPRLAFTIDTGRCRPGCDPHRVPRVQVFQHDMLVEFAFKLVTGRDPRGLLDRLRPGMVRARVRRLWAGS